MCTATVGCLLIMFEFHNNEQIQTTHGGNTQVFLIMFEFHNNEQIQITHGGNTQVS